MAATMLNTQTKANAVQKTQLIQPETKVAPHSVALASDLVDLQKQGTRSRNRRRENELARQRELARFD